MKRTRMRTRVAGPAGVIRLGVAVALAGAGLVVAAALPMSGAATRGGSDNKGDVFVDTVSTNTGPSGQTTPHMVCTGAQKIYIYGKDLSASSGTFTLTGQPPTGKKLALQGSWTFSAPPSTAQVIAVVDIPTLIASAKANGDTPHNDAAKGLEYKFKLDVGLKNAKQKVFWVTPCAAVTTPTPTPTPTPTATPTATPAGSVSGSSTTAGTAAVATPVTGAETAGIVGLTLLVSGAGLTVLGLARRRAGA